jgi:ABC-type branched-subunit amino acid transport system ATPase component
VDVELDLLTARIGQNNPGKTSLLNALFAAVGAGQRVISSDDVFLHKTVVSAPKERAIARYDPGTRREREWRYVLRAVPGLSALGSGCGAR